MCCTVAGMHRDSHKAGSTRHISRRGGNDLTCAHSHAQKHAVVQKNSACSVCNSIKKKKCLLVTHEWKCVKLCTQTPCLNITLSEPSTILSLGLMRKRRCILYPLGLDVFIGRNLKSCDPHSKSFPLWEFYSCVPVLDFLSSSLSHPRIQVPNTSNVFGSFPSPL